MCSLPLDWDKFVYFVSTPVGNDGTAGNESVPNVDIPGIQSKSAASGRTFDKYWVLVDKLILRSGCSSHCQVQSNWSSPVRQL